MAKKGWIVAAKNFEYNDEYYYETEGIHPVKVFTDKNEAERAAILQSIKEVKSIDYVSYFQGEDGEDSAFLDQYFRMVNGKESNPEKAKALTEAKRLVNQEATIHWGGSKNAHISFKVDDIEDYEKIIVKNNATITVGYDKKRMTLAELKKAVELVQNKEKEPDLSELRHEVNMSKLTDAQIETLLPLIPMSFIEVIETTIE